MENNFDYSSPYYLEVLQQLITDYEKHLTRNTPTKDPNDEMMILREQIKTFLISYSLSDDFVAVLNKDMVGKLWDTLRDDSMKPVRNFIFHLTIKMKLIYREAGWNEIIKDLAYAFDIRGEYPKNEFSRSPLSVQLDIDDDTYYQLPDNDKLTDLFKRNPWLVIVSMITLLRG